MASCGFCKASKDQLKSCVCKKVSYCSKECQAKDWKTHKPECPPFILKESPGKGKGLFATRKIKEGQIISDEYPLVTMATPAGGGYNSIEFKINIYPFIDDETKAKILELHDPAENFRTLDTRTIEELIRKQPHMVLLKEAEMDEVTKMFRIFCGNHTKFCIQKELYPEDDGGLYYNISRLNHSCVPNSTQSWVMGDFSRRQVRALKIIEKDEEIVGSYKGKSDFIYGNRQTRRQQLLELDAFLCSCSECSLQGKDLQDNEKMRADLRKKTGEIPSLALQLLTGAPASLPRRFMKKALKLSQQRLTLVKKLDLQAQYVYELMNFYHVALDGKRMGISSEEDPDVYKDNALKYAKLYGDTYIYGCSLFLDKVEGRGSSQK